MAEKRSHPGRGVARVRFTPKLWHIWMNRRNSEPGTAGVAPTAEDLHLRKGIEEFRERLNAVDRVRTRYEKA